MLNGEGQVLLREVEHIEDAVFRATVLAVVDGTDHLYDSLALMHDLRLAVLADNGQFALYQHTVIHCHMMVPSSGWCGSVRCSLPSE